MCLVDTNTARYALISIPLLLTFLSYAFFSLFCVASIGHPAVFIGDVKMSELRSFLSRNGFYTELQAGVLYCNRVITIRKDDNPAEFRSALTVEGTNEKKKTEWRCRFWVGRGN